VSDTNTASELSPTQDDFAALLEQSFAADSPVEGSVVEGRITAIENDLVIIDVGLKTEGRVPLREFSMAGQEPTVGVGDRVEVYLERIENAMGEAMLSRDKARREESWTKLEQSFAAEERVEGVIFGRVKGGFTVDLDGATAFLPGSQVDIRPVRDVTPLMNTKQPFQILKMDRRRRQYCLSRVAPLWKKPAPKHAMKSCQNLMEGQQVEGVVKNITDYGAFVDLGWCGRSVARHRYCLGGASIHPSEVLTVRRERACASGENQRRNTAYQPWHETAGNRSMG
jgi:small subunit ribosomal protein S1